MAVVWQEFTEDTVSCMWVIAMDKSKLTRNRKVGGTCEEESQEHALVMTITLVGDIHPV
jgi:hypothetical protein